MLFGFVRRTKGVECDTAARPLGRLLSRVTLTFDLRTLKLIVSCSCPLVHSFWKYHVDKFGKRRESEWTYKRTNERTNEWMDRLQGWVSSGKNLFLPNFRFKPV